MSTEAEPPLDPQMIAQLRDLGDGDVGILSELLKIFQQDAEPLLTKIEEHSRASNALGLKESAHALKGCAANLGAVPLAKLCGELERRGREGVLLDAEELAIRVRGQYALTCQAFQDEIDGG